MFLEGRFSVSIVSLHAFLFYFDKLTYDTPPPMQHTYDVSTWLCWFFDRDRFLSTLTIASLPQRLLWLRYSKKNIDVACTHPHTRFSQPTMWIACHVCGRVDQMGFSQCWVLCFSKAIAVPHWTWSSCIMPPCVRLFFVLLCHR